MRFSRINATHADILTSRLSSLASARPSPMRERSPTAIPLKASPTASVLGLSPVGLSAQDHSTSELLRTLSRVAASKPTSWLF
jgi:hypothetical protein